MLINLNVQWDQVGLLGQIRLLRIDGTHSNRRITCSSLLGCFNIKNLNCQLSCRMSLTFSKVLKLYYMPVGFPLVSLPLLCK